MVKINVLNKEITLYKNDMGDENPYTHGIFQEISSWF